MTKRENRVYGTVIAVSAFIIAVFAIVFILRFTLGGPEDSWICSGGQWIAHGHPIMPRPNMPCLE